MIIIHELDGYKHLGGHPTKRSMILRKNLTYIAFEFTDWDKDRHMLQFLSTHMDTDRIDDVYNLLESYVKDNKIKTHYLIIRQDDDDERYYGKESIMITNVRPKDIDAVLAFGKENYNDER